MTPKEETRKIDKLEFIKLKTFCVKGQCQKMKTSYKVGKKIFTNCLSDKSLMSGIYKELSDLKDDKQSN